MTLIQLAFVLFVAPQRIPVIQKHTNLLYYPSMPNLADNKQAHFDYEILERFEAGIVLTGAEVKSVQKGGINLKGSYITFHRTDAMLTNAHISPYPNAHLGDTYVPTASRKLLLHKKEIAYLRSKSLEKGLTVVPLKVYTSGRRIKLEIAVGRGKHSYDKRASIKKREVKREIERALKRG